MVAALDTVAAERSAGGEADRAAEPADIAAQLGAAALVCLREALDRCDDRAAALHLLAADALMTAACEAAATTVDSAHARDEREVPRALSELCAVFSTARLSALVSS
jgi:hypothetical protein